jgi:hypothetical protein
MPNDDLSKAPVSVSGTTKPEVSDAKSVNYIIAIGIDRYGGLIEEIRDFAGTCQKDCEDIITMLTQHYEGFEVFEDPLYNEDATLDAIEGIIDRFLDDPLKNNANNNLLLYFSGHGANVARKEDVPNGCWVPSQCPALKARLVVSFDNLINQLKGVATKHFILISDSCRSAQILDHQIFDAVNNSSRSGSSRFGIVSSRNDENSRGGLPGQNSVFTGALLKILGDADEPLPINHIEVQLEQYFAEDADQQPVVRRFFVQGEASTGQFIFQQEKDKVKRKKWRKMIPGALRSLNFDLQFDEFYQFREQGPKQFAIFKGTPNCGLGILLLRAKEYLGFPKHYPEKMVVSPFHISGIGSERILSIFSAALGRAFSNIEQLKRVLLEMLREKLSVVIQFEFHAPQAGSRPAFRDADKKQLLDDVADFINSVNLESNGNKLMLLVVDLEDADYYGIFGGVPIRNIPTIYMPAISRISEREAEKWYNNFRNNHSGDLAKFDALFNDHLQAKLNDILTETNGSPGLTIAAICSRLECAEVSQLLLTI